jgi:hypothetical protein
LEKFQILTFYIFFLLFIFIGYFKVIQTFV